MSDLRVGAVGPCLLHGEYHKLELKCWRSLRAFLHDCEVNGRRDPNENMKAYTKAVDAKRK